MVGYRKCSQDLGVVKSDVLSLACLLPVPWYWEILRSLYFDYPMVSNLSTGQFSLLSDKQTQALCALVLVWSSSSYIITTMVFFQSTISALRFTIEGVHRGCNLTSLLRLISQVQAFYKPLDLAESLYRDDILPYPNPSTVAKEGMEIELK